jgi:hypothetical protein
MCVAGTGQSSDGSHVQSVKQTACKFVQFTKETEVILNITDSTLLMQDPNYHIRVSKYSKTCQIGTHFYWKISLVPKME